MRKKFVLPCLRGEFGSWKTYTCTMQLKDIAELINFANELHNTKQLSEMIQRELKKTRTKEISDYLLDNQDRFFNSLVVGIYGGEPTWHDIGGLKPNKDELDKVIMPDYAAESIGFLSITRDEKMFALDGQHRLAGIKDAVKKSPLIGEDLLSVVIVAHKDTKEGIIKSRRLFTSLNKEAQPVSKEAIIALDEDDLSAKVTRYLVEETDFLNGEYISFSTGPLRDHKSITTIGNIFDCVSKLYCYFDSNIEHLEKANFDDFLSFCVEFYKNTFLQCKEIDSYIKSFNSISNNSPVYDLRNKDTGGHLLFRPIGWELYVDAYIHALNNGVNGNEAVNVIIKKDLKLEGDILNNVIWSSKNKRIIKATSKKWKSAINKLLS